MIIFGAGLAGLLAGNMLRRFEPKIVEAQSSLPNNHAALLRFRSNACSIAFSIPFRKVDVKKAVWHKNRMFGHADIRMQNMYAKKVTGSYIPRSIMNLKESERYIAPFNLIEQAAKNLDIRYSCSANLKFIEDCCSKDIPMISTIPMNVMMNIVGWEDIPEFKFMPIWSVTADIAEPATEVYQTIYSPGMFPEFYRASITGNRLIIELAEDPAEVGSTNNIIAEALEIFGIECTYENAKVSYQKYGKLLPIDDDIRKEFILYLTQEYGVYSLGRFATWRQLLMDDVVNDVHAIERMLEAGNNYNQIKKWSER